jgi:glucose/arabinose dehydrogenase
MKTTCAALLLGVGLASRFILPCFAEVGEIGPHPTLPEPNRAASVAEPPQNLGWPKGIKPKAPEGFQVDLYASELPNPRWIYVLPNQDVLVSEATGQPGSANRIELFRGMKSLSGNPKHIA